MVSFASSRLSRSCPLSPVLGFLSFEIFDFSFFSTSDPKSLPWMLPNRGKSYDVVSFAAQEPDATVLLPSGSESKVVGKISRRVCLVHYPEPGELEKPSRPSLSKLSAGGLHGESFLPQKSGWSMLQEDSMLGKSDTCENITEGSSRRGISELSTLERNERLRSSDMTTEISHGITTPSRSSKERSSVSGTSSLKGHSSKHSKRRQVDSPSPTEEPTRSADQSTRDSGWEGRSSISSFGNSDHSHEEKSKKKKKKMKVEE
ncbi:mediator-associated protein 2 isoform X2 [Magnolia sinica]|uniref:mediator-associated protein 2 isoform X2 n=1 Tax=Magnolia sinica TaxID=86752 RepID=UPI00265B2C50|nr:mediator-associated protein 2 isoform X2 [Magnolia sinica]